jgi:hypothetical protein
MPTDCRFWLVKCIWWAEAFEYILWQSIICLTRDSQRDPLSWTWSWLLVRTVSLTSYLSCYWHYICTMLGEWNCRFNEDGCLWVVMSCSLIEHCWHFRVLADFIIRVIVLVMEAAITPEMSVHFYQTLWCGNPDDSHLHTCCHENLICHSEFHLCVCEIHMQITNFKHFL